MEGLGYLRMFRRLFVGDGGRGYRVNDGFGMLGEEVEGRNRKIIAVGQQVR